MLLEICILFYACFYIISGHNVHHLSIYFLFSNASGAKLLTYENPKPSYINNPNDFPLKYVLLL